MNRDKSFLTKISKKGVAARKLIRKREQENIKKIVTTFLKDSKNNFLISRLCGFIMGDGCLEDRIDKKGWRHNEIRFYPDNLDVANLFIDTFEKIYQKRPTIRYVKNYYRVRVTSPVACKYLLKISGFSKLAWRVPNKILNNRISKIEFLKAMFDCEGSVGKRNVQLQSVNKIGIEGLKKLLSKLRIESKIYSYKRGNPRWNINYILIVSKKENIKRFTEVVGFNHPVKQRKLCLLADVPERLMGESRKLVSARTPRFES